MCTREAFVTEARSWYPTPYHKRGIIKHAGADCGSYLACVLAECGFLTSDALHEMMTRLESLQDDWFMHKAAAIYTETMTRHIPKIGERMTYGLPGEPPGNIVLMQTGNSKQRNHGGIVTKWPSVIHCIYEGVAEVNVLYDPLWTHKSITVYDPWSAA